MGANSILSHLDSGNTVSEIKLLLAGDLTRKKVVMLLEGEDDIKLFKFLVSENVILVKSYGAKGAIDSIIPNFFAGEKRVIAVRDKDYEDYSENPRIFYCDHCSCEMMMAASDTAFDRVATNHYMGSLNFRKLRYEILCSLRYVSVLRKCSYKYRWSLKINDVDLPSFISPGAKPGETATVKAVNRYNKNNIVDRYRVSVMRSEDVGTELNSLLDITNGHDFLAVFAIYCRASGKRNVRDKDLGSAMRCAFDYISFTGTALYAELKKYQREHGLNIVI